jgi:hypothetical protein
MAKMEFSEDKILEIALLTFFLSKLILFIVYITIKILTVV